jgi:hypothetical protein
MSEKTVLFWPYKYNDMQSDWQIPVMQLSRSFNKLGYTVLRHPHFKCHGLNEVSSLYDSEKHKKVDICLYNHTDISHIIGDIIPSNKNLFFKPTVPERGYTTLDTIGYGPYSSVTYEKPFFNKYSQGEVNDFYDIFVKRWIDQRSNKWKEHFTPENIEVKEKDYYLILGQCFGDEVITRHEFGSYEAKLHQIINELLRIDKDRTVLVKLHPYTNGKVTTTDGFAQAIADRIKEISNRVIVYSGNLSIHDFLPNCRCVFVANSGAGIEAMMHNKPIVSWGNPEYHWVTYRLLHLADIIRAIDTKNWFNKFSQQQFLYWYTRYYCFYDDDSCERRILEVLGN